MSKPLTLPLSSTRTLSAFSTEEMRWAMMNTVVPGIFSANEWRIFASVAVSTAEVESSRIRMRGFFSSARAMQRRCFWPPETLLPPCSMWVWYLSGKRSINSSAQACLQASSISASVASGRFQMMCHLFRVCKSPLYAYSDSPPTSNFPARQAGISLPTILPSYFITLMTCTSSFLSNIVVCYDIILPLPAHTVSVPVRLLQFHLPGIPHRRSAM